MRENFPSDGLIISNFQVVEVNCSSAASIPDRWESHLWSGSISVESQSASWPFALLQRCFHTAWRASCVLIHHQCSSWCLQAFVGFLLRPLHPLPGARSKDVKDVRCPPCSAKRTRPTKKRGNYSEETDRHVPIEFGSVSVHWLKVQRCLLAGWAWRQTTACQAARSTSDAVAAW